MRSLALALHTAKAFGLQVLGKSRGWGEGAGTLQRQGKKPILLPFQKNPYKSGNYTHYTLNFFDYTQISKFFPYKSRDYTITLITL